MKPTVAIVTPSTGRATLRRTIESVRAQTYSCTHYVFVDGERFHEAAREIVQDYPEVQVCYLPMNTGGDERKLLNSAINAAAPFLVKEDLLCYLDDDNWFAEHHVAGLVESLTRNQADYAYALRRLMDEQSEYICDDNLESLGFWKVPRVDYQLEYLNDAGETCQTQMTGTPHSAYLIDTNCYLMKREMAQQVAPIWLRHGYENDRNVMRYLVEESQFSGVCSGKRSVFYAWDRYKSWPLSDEMRVHLNVQTEEAYFHYLYANIQAMNRAVREQNQDENGVLPWEKEVVLRK
ncbi:MAG: glycosyltransferase family 2 protein [Neisseria sp.]|nr:glycosyltransferase family 2 protein [Neisseria sp.]